VSIGHATPAIRVESVSVAVNATGSAIVAWCEQRATGAAIAANLFVPGSGWGTATDLETITACVHSPDRAFWPNVSSVDTGITNLGVATAVWSSNGRVHLRRYAPGVGFRPIEALTSAGAAINPKVAVSLSSGDTIVAWKEANAAVHARRYSAVSGFWTPDTPLGGSGAIPTLGVGIDERGRGMVAFSEVNPGGGWAAAAARFNENFRPSEIVGIPMATAYELDLAMSRDGYAFLVWTQALRDVWGVVYHP
jgi:hypothetical protein